ncbi:MAG: Flp pilus assembly protein CpaB [Pseudomonadota bacterium]
MANGDGVKVGALFGGAVLFGIVAAIVAYIYLQAKDRALEAKHAAEQPQQIEVVVAGTDLPEGTKIGYEHFGTRPLPRTFVHSEAVLPGEFDHFIGRFLTTPISAGTSLLRSHMDRKFPIDFSDTIEMGQRAITVQVDDLDGVAGLIRPGNRVDIFVHLPVRASGVLPASLNALGAEKPPSAIVVPVIQDIFVLATADIPYQSSLDSLQRPQPSGERRYSNITLQTTPEQAALLEASREAGDLLAILRNREDRGVAEFDAMSSYDIAVNAVKVRREQQLRKLAEEAGATINENGDWVAADGTVIKSDNIVLNADGTASTKDGQLLGAPKMAELAAKAGASINENGDWVLADGTVVAAEDVVVNADGTITTRDGTLITAQNLDDLARKAGAKVNENGDWVLADGTVVKKEDIVVNADGTISTKSGKLLATKDMKVNANGDFVDKDGKVYARDDVQVLANGTILAKDGTVISGQQVTKTKDGFLVAEDGTVMTADGKVLTGVRVNANGEVVTADGTVLKADEVAVLDDGTVVKAKRTKDGFLVTEDGRIMTSDGKVLSGARLDSNGNVIAADGTVLKADDIVVAADGTVTTNDGRAIAGLSATDPAVDPSTMKRTKDGFYVAEDGTVMTADGKILKGVTVNENGEVVTADGTVLKADEIAVADDGTVTTRDGKIIAGVTGQDASPDINDMTRTKDGFYVSKDGTVMTADGKILSGVTVNENGEVVTSDGTVLKANEITVAEDGTVTTADGQTIAGVTGKAAPPSLTIAGVGGSNARIAPPSGLPPPSGSPEARGGDGATIALIVGGSGKDGVAKVTQMPIVGLEPPPDAQQSAEGAAQ